MICRSTLDHKSRINGTVPTSLASTLLPTIARSLTHRPATYVSRRLDPVHDPARLIALRRAIRRSSCPVGSLAFAWLLGTVRTLETYSDCLSRDVRRHWLVPIFAPRSSVAAGDSDDPSGDHRSGSLRRRPRSARVARRPSGVGQASTTSHWLLGRAPGCQ